MTAAARRPAPRRAPDDVLVHLRRARDHADRHYADELDLESLAAVAAISKWHFHRLFRATYGVSPAAYVSQRRVERAQDLLRATNLTVTEVCHAVGFSSLGSFSSRFRELVGETPTQFQRRYAAWRAEDPGLLRLHVGAGRDPAAQAPQARRSTTTTRLPRRRRMITNVSIVSVWVKDIDESLAFYTDVLGFLPDDDVRSARTSGGAPSSTPTSPSSSCTSPPRASRSPTTSSRP